MAPERLVRSGDRRRDLFGMPDRGGADASAIRTLRDPACCVPNVWTIGARHHQQQDFINNETSE
jgi:hypothetical protein